ncbi:hypothetical protein PCANB_003053 [Pneumocystis canis]|nr:hypothetical protein PCK1_003023 [Pneumocystis canis]KAG5438202.1 hypothetical protein PCANB_003053 [Pneumocystis canis]
MTQALQSVIPTVLTAPTLITTNITPITNMNYHYYYHYNDNNNDNNNDNDNNNKNDDTISLTSSILSNISQPESYEFNLNDQTYFYKNLPRVTTTLWENEGTLCFQVEAKSICVARREDNNMINGTKLLNVAGMSRGRRDGILKAEKIRSVVKIGAMHLKGVWIPFERALDFANRERITDLLYPLFVINIRLFLYHPTNYACTTAMMAAKQQPPMLQVSQRSHRLSDSCKDSTESTETLTDETGISVKPLTPPYSAPILPQTDSCMPHSAATPTRSYSVASASLPATPVTTPPAYYFHSVPSYQETQDLVSYSEPLDQLYQANPLHCEWVYTPPAISSLNTDEEFSKRSLLYQEPGLSPLRTSVMQTMPTMSTVQSTGLFPQSSIGFGYERKKKFSETTLMPVISPVLPEIMPALASHGSNDALTLNPHLSYNHQSVDGVHVYHLPNVSTMPYELNGMESKLTPSNTYYPLATRMNHWAQSDVLNTLPYMSSTTENPSLPVAIWPQSQLRKEASLSKNFYPVNNMGQNDNRAFRSGSVNQADLTLKYTSDMVDHHQNHNILRNPERVIIEGNGKKKHISNDRNYFKQNTIPFLGFDSISLDSSHLKARSVYLPSTINSFKRRKTVHEASGMGKCIDVIFSICILMTSQ